MHHHEQIRWQIVGAHRGGLSNSVISQALNVRQTTVARTVQAFIRRETVARKKGFEEVSGTVEDLIFRSWSRILMARDTVR